MNWSPIAQDLRNLKVGPVREDEPMLRHTSFRIGGPAAVFVEPEALDGVVAVLEWLRRRALPYFIVGQGTNILVSDMGLQAVVVSTSRGLRQTSVRGTTIHSGSGVLLTRLAHLAEAHGLTGLEFAVSIPGTLGGALVMNAGAHGSSMVGVVQTVLVWDAVAQVRRIGGAEAEFEYRQSRFQRSPWIALEAELALAPGVAPEIHARMRQFMESRKRSQPVGEPNAGSVFKNPLPLFAGRLIEAVGAKGWREGDAEISQIHANFIVNRGHATAGQVLALMRRVRRRVYQTFEVILHPEVRWVGPAEGGANATWDNLWYEVGEGLKEPSE